MACSISPVKRGQKRRSVWESRREAARDEAAQIIDIRCGSCESSAPVLRLRQVVEERHVGLLLSCWPRLVVTGKPRLPHVYAEAGVVSGAFVDGFPLPEQDPTLLSNASSPLVICINCVASGGAVAQAAAQQAATSVEELIREAAGDREAALQLEREIDEEY